MGEGYPSNWSSISSEIKGLDGYQCQNCGREGRGVDLEVHHIVPKSKGGTDDHSNLKTVCKRCHDAIHHRGMMAPSASRGGSSSSNSSSSKDRGLFWWLFVAPLLLAIKVIYVTVKLSLAVVGATLNILRVYLAAVVQLLLWPFRGSD